MRFGALLIVALALAAATMSGCGLARGVTGGNAGTVSELWADVPSLPNATKANLDIPLPVQLLIQGFIQAANADNNSDVKLDKFDFVVYQTPDAPSQVAEFYATATMNESGWNLEGMPGCAAGQGSGAGFCVFGKKGDAGRRTILMVVPVQDDQTKQTQVFYIRFEGTTKQ